jgi:hypothetical protein
VASSVSEISGDRGDLRRGGGVCPVLAGGELHVAERYGG